MAREKIKITYSTLSTPNPLVDQYFEEEVENQKGKMGGTYPMYINGEWVSSDNTFTKIAPIDTSLTVGHFASGNKGDIDTAVAAAKAAFPGWRDTPWQERVAILRKVADTISDRLFEMGAVLSMEVGKNRLEALGDVEETADLIRYCCDAMEQNDGFDRTLLSESERHHNRSILKPYGVWGVIAPFNFPAALSGGPCGGALVTGNTVVLKPADDAPLTSYMIAECFHDGGIPIGVFNMVTGGDEPGKALTANKDVDGITFTGSYPVGMSILSNFATSAGYIRPVIAEMGGKNPTIISEKADLDKASLGVMRSAFGLTGQKCSACSRVYVHNSIKDDFVNKLVDLTQEKITVGDPTKKENYMGPIINKDAYNAYKQYAKDLREAGKVRLGAETVEADKDGYYVAPTIVEDLPDDHYLWKHEMFAPIVVVAGFDSEEEAMEKANDVDLGLTAGFYSEDKEEVDWFLNNIQAGVLYVNRETGATTGCLAGLPIVRRLERQHRHRQSRWQLLLSPTIYARTKPYGC